MGGTPPGGGFQANVTMLPVTLAIVRFAGATSPGVRIDASDGVPGPSVFTARRRTGYSSPSINPSSTIGDAGEAGATRRPRGPIVNRGTRSSERHPPDRARAAYVKSIDSAPLFEVTCAIEGRDNGAFHRAACRVKAGRG